MLLLLDIGNTHTHVGLARGARISRQTNIPTREWFAGEGLAHLRRFVGAVRPTGAALCSVVPNATPRVCKALQDICKLR
ncbi:MAG: type III pantothenate kinase, partial [Limisphaerales bacterium]